MITHHNVNGYEECSKLLENLKSSGVPIVIYFSGSKNEDGVSWCPDCQNGKLSVRHPRSTAEGNLMLLMLTSSAYRDDVQNVLPTNHNGIICISDS